MSGGWHSRHDLSATGRYTSVGEMVSLPGVNGKPDIHPPKREGTRVERQYLNEVARGGSEILRF